MQRFVPTSPTDCEMRYEVYRNKSSTEEDFQLINTMYKRIMSEDKYLCVEAQKNLATGVFVNGLLHPRMEKGPLYFQAVVRDILHEHFDREKELGQQIWPARLAVLTEAESALKDEDGADADKYLTQGYEPINPSLGMTTQVTETAVY